MTESTLLDLYLKGDVAAFETIVSLHEQALLKFARRIAGDPALAQDVVQDTFIRLVREASNLRSHESLSTWLYRVCRNLCVDAVKKESRMRRRHAEAALPETYLGERAEVESIEERLLVSKKLSELPPKEREVLYLKIVEGKSYKEISDVTGNSVGHVGYLIHHGLKRLARVLQLAGVIETNPRMGEVS
ncbi:MAG: sigma-70 family RNA polymerase sigma factor [Planctomycetota bacterium]